MRRFPDVYLPGYREKLDPIRAWDLNELQRQGMLNFLGAASTRERLIVDEFAGDTLNRAIWADNVDKPAAPADDSANGGFGAVRFNSAPGTPKLLYTNCAIPAGALNYSLAIRVRVASRGATYRFRFGLVDDVTLGNGHYIGFQQDANSGNWLVGGLGPGWSSIAPTSTYQVLEYHKRGQVNLAFAALLAGGILVGVFLGAKLAGKLDDLVLRRAFGVFLMLVAARLLLTKR